jgi:hypothetical protein
MANVAIKIAVILEVMLRIGFNHIKRGLYAKKKQY